MGYPGKLKNPANKAGRSADKMPNSQQIGNRWEKEAESFLLQHGLTTRKRNFYCRSGEIDLIMNDGEMLVFVEVRYRGNDWHGSGAETVNARKQSRLIRAALYFLVKNPRFSQKSCRFDVISIGNHNGKTEFRWIRNAFDTPPG